MTELEKIKQARQVLVPSVSQRPTSFNAADATLKPRNVSIDKNKLQQINQLDEQIALSRYLKYFT